MSSSLTFPKSKRPAFREVRSGGAAAGKLPQRAARGDRLPNFLGAGDSPGTPLDKLRVTVVGAGSVGGAIAEHHARLQVRQIDIVEPGRLKHSSVLTHGIAPAAVGKGKARYFGGACKAISPKTRVRIFVGPVQALPMTAFGGVDLVVMATDNLAAEIEVGQRCLRQRIPLIQASVHGDTLVAQVRYWSNRDGSGSCPSCSFGDVEWSLVSKEVVFRCAGPDGRPVGDPQVLPTMSVSFLCSMAAAMAMMQILRLVLHLGRPLEDSVTEYCGYNHRTTVSPLVRNPQCRAEHVAWRPVPIGGRLAARSLRQLARAALGEDSLPPDTSFAVGDDLVFAETVRCCGWPKAVRRFGSPRRPITSCPRCGAALDPQPFYSHRPVPAAVLGPLLDRPLARLGAGSVRAVVVYSDGQAVLCQQEDEKP